MMNTHYPSIELYDPLSFLEVNSGVYLFQSLLLWQTNIWMYFIISLLIGAIIFLIYRLQLYQLKHKEEIKKITELKEFKNKLYTNLMHEFRTPLTMILSINELKDKQKNQKELINRNARNLLQLTDQILDLSKLENGLLKVKNQRGNVIPYLNYLTESFYSLAQTMEVRLAFFSKDSEVVMDYDEAKLQHIVQNLLSNALKATPPGGKVIFQANKIKQNNQDHLQLTLQDSGVGISPEQLPHVFDRFYQSDFSDEQQWKGSGLGLAFTKELIELMNGKISIESQAGRGTTVSLLLPITNLSTFSPPSIYVSDDKKDKQLVQNNNLINNPDLPLILVVEDNLDVRNYIQDILKNKYNLLFAKNGQEGLDKALEQIPALIISDVIMPLMNGYELCSTLKENERTSHIPFILLTARATNEGKIAGLKTGADAYLIKPFNKEELLVRIDKLLSLRKKLQASYSDGNLFELRSGASMSKEDLFLKKLHQVIYAHINDSALNAEIMAKAVNLSVSQLYRKLKELTKKSPNALIREIRLQRACQLLEDDNLNISEVAYSLGFKDPKYFSRVFHKKYGQSPMSYRK